VVLLYLILTLLSPWVSQRKRLRPYHWSFLCEVRLETGRSRSWRSAAV